ncbi:MAG: hypothetical protein K2X81_14740 [Candidatus Obscuribacterales bacterium]|nr:hypothetical protein [Candidatus Obscuribacterales bacterium]
MEAHHSNLGLALSKSGLALLVAINIIQSVAAKDENKLKAAVSLQAEIDTSSTTENSKARIHHLPPNQWVLAVAAKEPIAPKSFPPFPLTFDLPADKDAKLSAQARAKGWELNAQSNKRANARMYLDAEKSFRDGKLEKCIEISERAYFANPNPEFAKLVSLAYKKQGNRDLTKLWTQRANDTKRNDAKSSNKSVNNKLTDKSETEKASSHSNGNLATPASRTEPSSASAIALSEHAKQLLKEGKRDDADMEFRKAVLLDFPPDRLNELSECHRAIGEHLLEQAYQSKDEGHASEGMRILALAGIEFRRAACINPDNEKALRDLTECGLQAVSIEPSFDNHLYLGSAYVLSKDFAHARIEYLECYRLNKNRAELEDARKAYHLSIARSPSTTDAQVEDSIEKVTRIIEEMGADSYLWYVFGRLRERQGNMEKAKQCYDISWSINKFTDPDLKLAYIRLKEPDPDHAPKVSRPATATSTTAQPQTTQEKDSLSDSYP